MLFGIDLASHQGPNYSYPTKPQFAIIKASGGHSYQNEHLAEQVRTARQQGIVVGFYHYMFEPSYGGGNVGKEAHNFIETVRPYVQKGTTLWLDVEEYPGSVGFTGDLGQWIVDFCEAVQAEYGCVCGIYCATWYLVPTGLSKDVRLTKYPFWVASWQDSPPQGKFLAPWTKYTLWQYDATGIDKNRFEGNMEEFLALGVPANAPVAPGNEVRTGVLEDGRPYVQVVFAGNTSQVLGGDVQDLGISVASATQPGVILDQSVQHNAFQGWRVR